MLDLHLFFKNSYFEPRWRRCISASAELRRWLQAKSSHRDGRILRFHAEPRETPEKLVWFFEVPRGTSGRPGGPGRSCCAINKMVATAPRWGAQHGRSSGGLGRENVATQKQSKKDSNLRDLFAKTLAKKQDLTRELGLDPRGSSSEGTVDENANPVTKAFMEQLFGTLREDLAALRKELAMTPK
ncbi:hypothetical protein NDU88_001254 [Pleurodeles waltl]|uniref:Uncharacterized protein n=1 Tax=Pleurodeles waltl TaxID=8319 RepID=A0AAV7MPE2_PLEWA|nr:hypothetical protein NDU88_001254 [Pleurodeles waltl]